VTEISARQLRIGAIIMTLVVGVLGGAYYWFLSGDYGVLARGVRAEEAAAIVEELRKQEIAYELRDGGTTILVPASQLDAVRLHVASGDLPVKGTVGFELFNQSDMGLTDFAQKVNYQRALQGEIARTIMAMDGIAHARVHIALPERALFRMTRSEPRAAVTLTPQQGVQIDGDRIAGIQRLVAATVPDLALDQVAVLNERGQLLTPEFSDVPTASSSSSALEDNYRQRVSHAIASVAPRAHIQVKVTVMSRAGSSFSSGPAGQTPGAARDHSIRVILFERSVLSSHEKQLIQRAVNTELTIDAAAGDQLFFSPAPQIAAASLPPMPISAVQSRGGSAGASVESRFMANLERSWTIVLWTLAAAAALIAAFRIRRGRWNHRQELAVRIREQLLLVEGSAHAV
jgi:flagellar M-ring protein FliF